MFWHQKNSRQSKITMRSICRSKINPNRRILVHRGRVFRNLKPIKRMSSINHWNSKVLYQSRHHKANTTKEYYHNKLNNSKVFFRNNSWICLVKIKDSNINNFMDRINSNSAVEIAITIIFTNSLLRMQIVQIIEIWCKLTIIITIIINLIRTITVTT